MRGEADGQEVTQFSGAQEAKDFLVLRIALEAELEGNPLSEIERKELYFSETAWTLPDIFSVNEEFEQTYDQDDYEQRIAELIRKAHKRERQANPDAAKQWSAAVRTLAREDHYILVMVDQAGIK